jgi:hypothetical protein
MILFGIPVAQLLVFFIIVGVVLVAVGLAMMFVPDFVQMLVHTFVRPTPTILTDEHTKELERHRDRLFFTGLIIGNAGALLAVICLGVLA